MPDMVKREKRSLANLRSSQERRVTAIYESVKASLCAVTTFATMPALATQIGLVLPAFLMPEVVAPAVAGTFITLDFVRYWTSRRSIDSKPEKDVNTEALEALKVQVRRLEIKVRLISSVLVSGSYGGFMYSVLSYG